MECSHSSSVVREAVNPQSTGRIVLSDCPECNHTIIEHVLPRLRSDIGNRSSPRVWHAMDKQINNRVYHQVRDQIWNNICSNLISLVASSTKHLYL